MSEKMFEPIRKCGDKIDDVKNFYELQILAAKENLTIVEDDLLDWSTNVKACIENGGPRASENLILQKSRETTTTTTKPTTTTRTSTTTPRSTTIYKRYRG
jgi:hypothetical protein